MNAPSRPAEIRFRLRIDPDEFEAYYRGEVRNVLVTSIDGRRLQFPANILRPFVTRDGIEGLFVLRYDADGRFHSIERL